MADWDPFADPAEEVVEPPKPALPPKVAAAKPPEAASAPTAEAAVEAPAEDVVEVPSETPAAAAAAPAEGDLEAPIETEVTIGKMTALHNFPAGGGRITWGILIVGGNPTEQFGNATMHLPVLNAVVKRLSAAGLHWLRFDWPGTGMSKGTYDESETPTCIGQCAAYMLEHHCKCLVLCGYSMGSQTGMQTIPKMPQGVENVKLIVSLSTGMEVWKWVAEMGQDYGKKFKETCHTTHKACIHPIKYICGEKDRMTPIAILQDLLKQRPDKGEETSVSVIAGAPHDFAGHEDEAARAAVEWLIEEM